MLENDDQNLAERLNTEPLILFGYTDSEFLLAIKLACLLCFPIGLWVGYMVNNPMPGLGLGFLLGIALVVTGGKALQPLKRGRPDFYYQMRLKLWLYRLRIGDMPFIRYQGTMGLGRTWRPRL